MIATNISILISDEKANLPGVVMMTLDNVQMMAGTISSIIFVMGTFPMLYKAWRTKNLQSYSLPQLISSNAGNLIYWLYVASLPFGPVWLLHMFNTAVTFLMLVWYLIYNQRHMENGVESWKRQTLVHQKVS
jgi:uncharacterized protein with PQ loop repeat